MALTSSIRIGPFTSAYHRALVDSAFIEQFQTFVEQRLISQLDHPLIETTGSISACFDDDRFCGPISAIRNLFHVELTFQGPSEASVIQTDLNFDPSSGVFSGRHGKSLYVWTPRRQQRRDEDRQKIKAVIAAIQEGGDDDKYVCPLCQSQLVTVNTGQILDVRCPSRCFKYNFHKDKRGKPLHGHFFSAHREGRAEP